MIRKDSFDSARDLVSDWDDPRVQAFWDEKKVAPGLFSAPLGLERAAWDVYMVYRPGAVWTSSPPAPWFWMHQLEEADPSTALDAERLSSEVGRALGLEKR